jgi:hypothetical protein
MMAMRSSHSLVGVLVVGSGMLVAAGAALAIAGGQHAPHLLTGGVQDRVPIQLAPKVGEPVVPSGNSSDVLRTIESGLTLVSAARVTTQELPTEATTATTTGRVLEYDLHVPSFAGADVTEAIWQGNLFAGSVRDAFYERDLGTISHAYGTLVNPAGERQLIGGGFGRVVQGQIFDPIPNGLGEHLSQSAGAFRIDVQDVTEVRGLQSAVVIRATTDAPRQAVSLLMKEGALASLIGMSPSQLEGVFLQVRDGTGKVVYAVGTAPRDGAVTVWAGASTNDGHRGQHLTP